MQCVRANHSVDHLTVFSFESLLKGQGHVQVINTFILKSVLSVQALNHLSIAYPFTLQIGCLKEYSLDVC